MEERIVNYINKLFHDNYLIIGVTACFLVRTVWYIRNNSLFLSDGSFLVSALAIMYLLELYLLEKDSISHNILLENALKGVCFSSILISSNFNTFFVCMFVTVLFIQQFSNSNRSAWWSLVVSAFLVELFCLGVVYKSVRGVTFITRIAKTIYFELFVLVFVLSVFLLLIRVVEEKRKCREKVFSIFILFICALGTVVSSAMLLLSFFEPYTTMFRGIVEDRYTGVSALDLFRHVDDTGKILIFSVIMMTLLIAAVRCIKEKKQEKKQQMFMIIILFCTGIVYSSIAVPVVLVVIFIFIDRQIKYWRLWTDKFLFAASCLVLFVPFVFGGFYLGDYEACNVSSVVQEISNEENGVYLDDVITSTVYRLNVANYETGIYQVKVFFLNYEENLAGRICRCTVSDQYQTVYECEISGADLVKEGIFLSYSIPVSVPSGGLDILLDTYGGSYTNVSRVGYKKETSKRIINVYDDLSSFKKVIEKSNINEKTYVLDNDTRITYLEYDLSNYENALNIKDIEVADVSSISTGFVIARKGDSQINVLLDKGFVIIDWTEHCVLLASKNMRSALKKAGLNIYSEGRKIDIRYYQIGNKFIIPLGIYNVYNIDISEKAEIIFDNGLEIVRKSVSHEDPLVTRITSYGGKSVVSTTSKGLYIEKLTGEFFAETINNLDNERSERVLSSDSKSNTVTYGIELPENTYDIKITCTVLGKINQDNQSGIIGAVEILCCDESLGSVTITQEDVDTEGNVVHKISFKVPTMYSGNQVLIKIQALTAQKIRVDAVEVVSGKSL